MLRFINFLFIPFFIQCTVVSAQKITGHWQNSEGVNIFLTEDGIAKIDNTNGIFYGKWAIDSEEIILNLFSEYAPYTYTISDFFADLTYMGEAYIPESELAIYRNGYQLDPLPAKESQSQTGAVTLDTKWLVTPNRLKGTHVGVWEMEDGTQLDLSEWGMFRVFKAEKGTSYGLFEIDGEILRLQFLFQDATYEYELSSLENKQHVGFSTLTITEFQQAEQQMFNLLISQIQSTNQMVYQMTSQMLEQTHQATMKMIINLSGNDWIYENESGY